MAVTAVGIANMALSLIGNRTGLITAFNETTEPGRQANLWYEPTRDATLQAHPWNFAIRRTELAQIADEPAYGYAYAYALPDDYLRVVQTELEDVGMADNFRIEGQLGSTSRVLLSDEGTLKIEYIAQITDPNAFSPTFVQALATHLAAKMCPALTDSMSRTKELYDAYSNILREARAVDAQEGTPRGLYADTWINARA